MSLEKPYASNRKKNQLLKSEEEPEKGSTLHISTKTLQVPLSWIKEGRNHKHSVLFKEPIPYKPIKQADHLPKISMGDSTLKFVNLRYDETINTRRAGSESNQMPLIRTTFFDSQKELKYRI
jgi:hypothetical protein